MTVVDSDRHIALRLTSPLGDAAIALRLEGREALSEPFAFRVTLRLVGEGDPSALLGEGLTVTLVGEAAAEGERVIHGIVTAVEDTAEGMVVELRPWLALLELRADRRVFQSQTPVEIVEAVAAAAGFSDLELRLQAAYDPLEYRVQAGESDFAFVTRLLAEHGIAYFFTFETGRHVMVLADDVSAFSACPGAAELPFHPDGSHAATMTNVRIAELDARRRLVSQRVTLGDFAFATPSTRLRATVGDGAREVYAYPGGFATGATGDARARRRLDAHTAAAADRVGTSPCRQLAAGTTTTITGHPTAALNGEVLLRAVEHAAGPRQYVARFEAADAAVPFRPPLPPRAPAPALETAAVVGPAGEEVFTDEHGRIKVKFAWDRGESEDESCSCWLRVAQSWAGSGFGAFVLPRIGQEVLIAFLDGDPDRPLVVGSVYNGDHAAPYPLPDNATRSVFKTQSLPGGDGFNELSFEDKAGEEEIYLKSQKDWRVEIGNDVTQTVTENRSTTIENGNDTLTVSTGARNVSVKGAQTHDTGGAHTQSVKGAYTLDVVGDISIKTQGSLTLDAMSGITLKTQDSVTVDALSGVEIKSSTGDVTVSGMSGVTLKTTAGDVTINSAMGLTGKAGLSLSLSGTMMEVKGDAMGTINGGGMLIVQGGLVKIN